MSFAGEFVQISASGINSPVSGLVVVISVPALPPQGTYLGRYYLFHNETGGVDGGYLLTEGAVYAPALFLPVNWPFVSSGTDTFLTAFLRLKYGWFLQQAFFV
jgi:hypothetical protein